MAKVLGASTMQVRNYEQVVYENIYEGVSLVVSIVNKKVKFDLETNDRKAIQNFRLVPWGNSSQYDAVERTFKSSDNNNTIKITSENESMSFTSKDGFQFKNPESNTDKLSFEISIK